MDSRKKLAITGDIIVGPTPYETHGKPEAMLKAIQYIAGMHPAIIIPGHGRMLYDLNYINLLSDAFKQYTDLSLKAIQDKVPVNDAFKSLRIQRIDDQFIQGDEVKKWAYESFFVRNLIYYTYKNNGAIPPR